MNKYFQAMEKVPLVKSLQVVAGLVLAIGIINLILRFIPLFASGNATFASFTMTFLSFPFTVVLYQFLVLLTMAKVIQLLSERK